MVCTRVLPCGEPRACCVFRRRMHLAAPSLVHRIRCAGFRCISWRCHHYAPLVPSRMLKKPLCSHASFVNAQVCAQKSHFWDVRRHSARTHAGKNRPFILTLLWWLCWGLVKDVLARPHIRGRVSRRAASFGCLDRTRWPAPSGPCSPITARTDTLVFASPATPDLKGQPAPLYSIASQVAVQRIGASDPKRLYWLANHSVVRHGAQQEGCCHADHLSADERCCARARVGRS